MAARPQAHARRAPDLLSLRTSSVSAPVTTSAPEPSPAQPEPSNKRRRLESSFSAPRAVPDLVTLPHQGSIVASTSASASASHSPQLPRSQSPSRPPSQPPAPIPSPQPITVPAPPAAAPDFVPWTDPETRQLVRGVEFLGVASLPKGETADAEWATIAAKLGRAVDSCKAHFTRCGPAELVMGKFACRVATGGM